MGPKRGHFSRSRDLKAFNRKFSKNVLQNFIKKRQKKEKKVSVLEIGCGEGRVLMQLRKLFPEIELHGINKKPWSAMKGSQSLKTTAKYYRIFTASEIKKAKIPKIHFTNAKKLDFKDNYFDMIYSQVAIQYVDRKDQLLEEVWRVLKPGGKAFIHIDTRHEKNPDYLQFETPRFIIYKKNKVYPVKKLIKSLKGFDIKYKEYPDKEQGQIKNRICLIITKNSKKKLKLNLKFEELSSFNLGTLNKEKSKPSLYWWGYRSVFRI